MNSPAPNAARREPVRRDAPHTDLKIYKLIVENTRDPIALVDRELCYRVVNRAYAARLGTDPGKLVGSPVDASALSPGAPRPRLEGLGDALAGRVVRFNDWGKTPQGRRCEDIIYSPFREDGAVTGVLISTRDLTDLQTAQTRENERRLEHLATHDPLTGLANRSQLGRILERFVRRERGARDAFTVLFIDLDHFKAVNDTLGHSAGDKLLREAATRLQGVLRAEDFLARIGGDEFVAVLQDIASATSASVIAQKILTSLRRPFLIEGQQARISASIGIASFPADGDDADSLLRHADTAMYEVKGQGGSGWRYYAPEMTAAAERHLTLINALAGARERGEQRLEFQPEVDLQSGDLVGLEALLRWHHPELGDVDAREVIRAAEAGGHIRDLDSWVLEEVCAQIAAWRAAGLEPPVVSMNLSIATLLDADFDARLRAALARYGLSGPELCLELPEVSLLPSAEEARDRLLRLRDLGVRLAVDNFGSGQSALSYLARLPINELKIDGSLIETLGKDTKIDAVFRAIEALCRSLGLQLVASGVETERQRAILDAFAPMTAQGFLFGRPTGSTQVAALLGGAGRDGTAGAAPV